MKTLFLITPTKLIITIILFLFTNSLFGQFEKDLNTFTTLREKRETKKEYAFAKDPSNEIEFVLSGMFLFYKHFISSQDGSSCTFTPSCSAYALITIKKQGFIMGSIDFFDRLSRCNGLDPENYETDPYTHMLIDPPRNFFYEKL